MHFNKFIGFDEFVTAIANTHLGKIHFTETILYTIQG